MKTVYINPQNIKTSYDNKKKEIKKYIDNLDFNQGMNEEENTLKRIALLTLNIKEKSFVTLDYKNNKIDIKDNIELLVVSKITNKEKVLIKVISNEDNFIKDFNAEEIKVNIDEQNDYQGFINWKNKSSISNEDWSNLEFLLERIKITSFEDVLSELINKNNNIYLSENFLLKFIKNNQNKEFTDYYFSKIKKEDLENENIIKIVKENFNESFFWSYFDKVLVLNSEKNTENKNLKNIIKNEIINENNIEKIVNKDNINNIWSYLPSKLRKSEIVIDSVVDNLTSNKYSSDKIDLDKAIKIIGESYLLDKKNFIYFIERIKLVSLRTNEQTDKMLDKIVSQFNINDDIDRKWFNYLLDGCKSDYVYSDYGYNVESGIIRLIVNKNQDKLNDLEKIKLYAKDLIKLEKEEIVNLIKTENEMELLLNDKTVKNREIISLKIKSKEDILKLINKKENIILFLNIALHNNWLKNKIIPDVWKNDNEIILKTYGKNRYKEIPLEARKELESSIETIKKIINLNSSNFEIIRNSNKYELSILKNLAYDNAIKFKEILKTIPVKNWYNFEFSIEMLKYHPDSLNYIPNVLFNNKQFTLNIFEAFEYKSSLQMKNLIEKLPEEFKSFLQDNQINSNYSEMLKKHFRKDFLEITLSPKNTTNKKNKI